MEHERKTLTLELKATENAPEGAFTATFATLNVIDHHGDVTLPGAFEPGKRVLIGGYQHDMLGLPVGAGTIQVAGDRAYVEGAFFTDTGVGLETYRTVKNAADLMEWSYIFSVARQSDGMFEQAGVSVPVRFLEKLDVWSVDPVLKGAGIGTRTDEIKALHYGREFVDHAEGISAAVDDFVARVKARADVRAKEGRTFSTANTERMLTIAGSLHAAADDLEQMLAAAKPVKTDLRQAYLVFQRNLALAEGVLVNS